MKNITNGKKNKIRSLRLSLKFCLITIIFLCLITFLFLKNIISAEEYKTWPVKVSTWNGYYNSNTGFWWVKVGEEEKDFKYTINMFSNWAYVDGKNSYNFLIGQGDALVTLSEQPSIGKPIKGEEMVLFLPCLSCENNIPFGIPIPIPIEYKDLPQPNVYITFSELELYNGGNVNGTVSGTLWYVTTGDGFIEAKVADITNMPFNLYFVGTGETQKSSPIASFSYSPENPQVGKTIIFDPSLSIDPDGTIEKYEWDFGNGFKMIGGKGTLTYVYNKKGTYIVTLTVTDNDGLINSIQKSISVGTVSPIASFSISPENPKADEQITFDASASLDPDGTIEKYEWDFGDRQTSEGKIVSYTYDSAGEYIITLTVTDNDGQINSAQKNLKVNPFSPTITFFDKDRPLRQVKGAAADGSSEVIIQISNLPSNITNDKIEIHVSPEDGSMIGDTTTIVDGVYKQTYKAPEYFVREKFSLLDLKQGNREIEFRIYINKPYYQWFYPKITLIKPPVVLLNGLWDDSLSWLKLKTKLKTEYGYDNITYLPYTNSISPELLKTEFDNIIYTSLLLARIDSTVVKKVDVVAHSMGGIVTKLYGNGSNINSIITVGTPHYGSPFADILWDLVDDNNNPFERFIAHRLDLIKHNATNGAVKYLRTTTLKIEPNRENVLNVPKYAIAGISPLTDPSTVQFFKVVAEAVKLKEVYYPSFLPLPSDWLTKAISFSADLIELNQEIFKNERNDLIVSESSQKGGLDNAVSDYVWSHLTEPSDKEIMEKIITFLNRSGPVYQPAIAQIVSSESQKIPKLRSTIPKLEVAVSSGNIEITHPSEGQVFRIGDTVNVEIEVPNESAAIMISVSSGESGMLYQTPYSFQFVIPNEVIGTLNIGAGAMEEKGFIGSDEVTIKVECQAKILDFKVYPDINSLNLLLGVSAPLAVYGVYDDNVTRDITSESTGTSYVSSDSTIVQVTSEGVFTVKSHGEAIITIENSGIKKEITIIGESVPNIVVNPISYNFDSVTINNSSPVQSITVSNMDSSNLIIGTITISGSNADQFKIQNDNCSLKSIAPLESKTIDVAFLPTSNGVKSANLNIPSNDPDTPILIVPLSGKGILATISIDNSSSNNNKNKKSLCLIDRLNLNTSILTRFRDSKLMSNTYVKKLVNFYYKINSKIIDFIDFKWSIK